MITAVLETASAAKRLGRGHGRWGRGDHCGVPDEVDFFVSHASADRLWAEWIAWELKQAGHSAIMQAWDMQPGANFVLEMDNATRAAKRTIAVLSPAFLESPFCRAEWAAAFRSDPTGGDRRLVGVRVRECEPDGLLGSVVYLDLVGLSLAASRDKLLAGLAAIRAKPFASYPGTDPRMVRRQLRGVSRTERVFELRATGSAFAGTSSVAAEPVALALPRSLHALRGSVFVGRDVELERLRERWSAVQGGAGSVIVIGGAPGIGKTRLACEFARAMHEQGAVVLYGRCDEGLAVPYQPFLEALRPYARAVGLDRLRAELGHLAPELGRLLPEFAELGEPVRADPESERYALFEAVAALIEAMTRQQHALLVFDDLHWAASPTLLMLRHLIRSERRLGALVLCTYRETELDLAQPLGQLLADLQRDASVERLRIGGLDEPAIAALVLATLGHALDEREELVHLLRTQTAGNPFFVRELLSHLAESGTLSPAGECSTPAVTPTQLQVPEGLRHVIEHRVARLSTPARHVQQSL